MVTLGVVCSGFTVTDSFGVSGAVVGSTSGIVVGSTSVTVSSSVVSFSGSITVDDSDTLSFSVVVPVSSWLLVAVSLSVSVSG